MHIVKSRDGQPRKVYTRHQGTISSRFLPGTYFEHLRSIDPAWSMKNISKALQSANSDGQCIIPNLPIDSAKQFFSIKKRFLRDDPRVLLTIDVDSSGLDLLAWDDLNDRSLHWIKARGLPQNLAFAAKWSSSRFLDNPEKQSAAMHIILKASRPVSSSECEQIYRALGSDYRMAERGRILATRSPTGEEDLFISSNRYAEMAFQEGEPLDVDSLLDSPQEKEESSPRLTSYFDSDDSNLGDSFFFKQIKKHYELSGEKPPWRDIRELCRTSSKLLSEGLIRHRHSIHYWLLRLCFHLEKDCYTALSEITNDKILLGKHNSSELFQQISKVKHDFRKDSSCGNINEVFEEREIVHVELSSFKDMKPEDFEALDIKRGSIGIYSGEGSGKTFFCITPIIDRFDPETIISICHRLNCLHSQSEQWGLTYLYDIGKDDPQFRNLSEQERKQRFIPLCDTPAITYQALDYLGPDGESKRKQIVIADELEHVLEEFVLSDQAFGIQNEYDQMNERFYRFVNMIEQADLFIYADAMMSSGLTGYFLSLLSKFRTEEKRLLLNHEDYVQRMRFHKISSREEAILTAIRILQGGETLAICSDFGEEPDMPQVDHIAKIIKSAGGFEENQIKSFHKGEKHHSRPNMYRDPHKKVIEEFDNGMICSVFSPAYDTGWQIAINDPRYTFDNVMLINGHGLTHAEKCKEFIRRFRFTTSAWIYIKEKRGKIRPHQLRSHRQTPQPPPISRTEEPEEELDFIIT